MLTLDLPPSAADRQGIFQQVDAAAALQQLQLDQRAPQFDHKSPKQSSNSSSSFFRQFPAPATAQPQAPKQSPAARSGKPTNSSYAHDGMRLSDLGEEPLAINAPRSPRQRAGMVQPEASALDLASTSGRSIAGQEASASNSISNTRGKGYVCNPKNDPLVKGRSVQVFYLATLQNFEVDL